jgi:hypothetical protein
MSKLKEVRSLIVDARYLVGLIEIAAHQLETPKDLAISVALALQ